MMARCSDCGRSVHRADLYADGLCRDCRLDADEAAYRAGREARIAAERARRHRAPERCHGASSLYGLFGTVDPDAGIDDDEAAHE